MMSRLKYWLAGCVLLPAMLFAQESPTVSIIIDDLGYRLEEGRQVIQLPGPLTYAVIPFTPHGRELAEQAHAANKEVMLHVPMQSVEIKAPSTGEMLLEMNRSELMATLYAGLDDVPHVIGINNHQGSLLTRHPGHMAWLMAAINARGGLFFVDSRTTRQTVAEQLAREYQVPVLRRDVFLDHDPDEAVIRAQFLQLVERAKRHGYAVGIGHPYPETIRMLEQLLPQLSGMGVTLVPISEQVRRHTPRSLRLTQVR